MYFRVWKAAVKSDMPNEADGTLQLCLSFNTLHQWKSAIKLLPNVPSKTPPQPSRGTDDPSTPSTLTGGFPVLSAQMAELRAPPSTRARIFCNNTEISAGCSAGDFMTCLSERPKKLDFLGSVLDPEFEEVGSLLDQVNDLMEGDGDQTFSRLFSRRKAVPESKVQRATGEHLEQYYPDLLVIDTSTTDNSPMSASLPSTLGDNEPHHLWNNRIDFASPLFPCGSELKESSEVGHSPHLDGLQQGLKRILVLTQRAAHLKRVIIFVLAPHACTMIIAASSFMSPVLKWSIHLVSIPVSHMLPL